MKVGILGSGVVAQSLAIGFAKTHHEVMVSNREQVSRELELWATKQNPKIKTGSFSDAARFGEIIVVATMGLATEQAIKKAGTEYFNGKTVLDTTNPLDFTKGFPPLLAGSIGDSGGERIQRLLNKSHVVKVFNTVGHSVMFKPNFLGSSPDMFICGDHSSAKDTVKQILGIFGWNAVDIGGISGCHYLEAMAMIWILSASLATPQSWDQAFKMLGRSA